MTPREKTKLVSYQLKEVEQVWLEKWRDQIPVRAVPVDWGVFKTTFLDRFFPIELREKKLLEFMNLRQRGMSLKEYSLKFTQLSKYAPTLVSYSRERINKFVMGVSSMVDDEFCVLHPRESSRST